MYLQFGDKVFSSCKQVSGSVTAHAPEREEECGMWPRGAGSQHPGSDVWIVCPGAPGPVSVSESAAGERGEQEVKSISFCLLYPLGFFVLA